MSEPISAPRNLFEFDNARYLSGEEIAKTFIPTKSFWRLLSAKNHVVLGARGSGKTAIARMLALPQLSRFGDRRAKRIVGARAFIGIYVPTKAEWVGALKNKPWMNPAEKEDLFRWRLNLATSIGTLATIRCCLEQYTSSEIQYVRAEIEISQRLARDWLGDVPENKGITSLDSLVARLDDLNFAKQMALAVRNVTEVKTEDPVVGLVFHTEPFVPMRRALRHASEVLDLPDTTTWMLCLDEAEALEEFHQRILNSSLRTHSDNLVFKITTTPYGHYTLDTNVGAGLSVGHDFEYVYIDRDFSRDAPGGRTAPDFESRLFKRRAQRSGRDYKFVSVNALLGPSPLLTPLETNAIGKDEIIREIEEHGSPQLRLRVAKISDDSGKLGNEVLRKIAGAVLLRRAVRSYAGQAELSLYSGAAMIARCCDGNPRRMIRLFNKLLLEGNWSTKQLGARVKATQISAVLQTQILRNFSVNSLVRVQPEPGRGRDVYRLLLALGNYMRHILHAEPLSTDQVTSVIIDEETHVADMATIKAAVGLGLLYPNVHPKNPDELPEGGGTFHLAYALAPAFNLMPRRGKARRIQTMLLPRDREFVQEQQSELNLVVRARSPKET